MEGYCCKCKHQRDIKSPHDVVLKNGRHAVTGLCSKCGTKMFKFVKK